MADDDAITRRRGHGGKVVEYHFTVTINVLSDLDEKRIRKLIDEQLATLTRSLASKPR